MSIKKVNFPPKATLNFEPEQLLFIFTVRSNQYIIVSEFDMQTIARAVEIWFPNIQNILSICSVGLILQLMRGCHDRQDH